MQRKNEKTTQTIFQLLFAKLDSLKKSLLDQQKIKNLAVLSALLYGRCMRVKSKVVGPFVIWLHMD